MTQPVVKMYTMRYNEAWYQLSREEQEELMVKVRDALKKVGGKQVISCLSLWSSEKWMAFGMEKFPSFEAELLHTQMLFDLGWYRYVDSESQLGIETS